MYLYRRYVCGGFFVRLEFEPTGPEAYNPTLCQVRDRAEDAAASSEGERSVSELGIMSACTGEAGLQGCRSRDSFAGAREAREAVFSIVYGSTSPNQSFSWVAKLISATVIC
ncbi:hypothetical protein [Pelagicoccus mobilis]|uniref:Uncharacterized protein n=1 Tax=Pelagicoccus mobilis TaxID=415221 RepID=A0A934VR60_9BACT|nr:hypothetical protein [Pelagicoccus mobilis]MBK1877204.1 hypothetical protein [Pelagicoccus mobilis]